MLVSIKIKNKKMIYKILGFGLLILFCVPPLLLSFLIGRMVAVALGIVNKNRYGLYFMLIYMCYHIFLLFLIDSETFPGASSGIGIFSLCLAGLTNEVVLTIQNKYRKKN